MTAKAALCMALLEGKVLNVKNCFNTIGITNCAREVSRSVEKAFGVKVSKTHRVGKNTYGEPIFWTDYRLNNTEYNKAGIEKMREYCKQHTKPSIEGRTPKEQTIFRQQELFLNQ